MVEHAAVNRRVVGSSPTSGAIFCPHHIPILISINITHRQQYELSRGPKGYRQEFFHNDKGYLNGFYTK